VIKERLRLSFTNIRQVFLRDRRGVTCLIPKKIPNSNGMLKRGNPLCSLNSVRDKSWIENLQNLIKR
jgi:hypothetical protein